jgi:hypothetical protein
VLAFLGTSTAMLIWDLYGKHQHESLIRGAIARLGSNLTIPAWVVASLMALTVAAVAGCAILAWSKLFKYKYLDQRYYVADRFFGLTWRWNYGDFYHSGISDLTAYCPDCDAPIEPMTTQMRFDETTGTHRHIFVCSHCGHSWEVPAPWHDLLDHLLREIPIKLRNGSWEKAVRKARKEPPWPAPKPKTEDRPQ